MRLASFLPSLLLLVTATSAWPTGWDDVQDVAKRELAPLLLGRADKANQPASSSAAAAASSSQPAKGGNKNSKTTAKKGNNNQASSSSAPAKTGKNGKTTAKPDKGKATTTHSKYETTKTYDARKPPGGISMITPGPLEPSQYYKIRDYVTFAWNFTSLSQTPSAVDVLASCSLNSATYTIAVNASITGPTQAVTWDTGGYQNTAATPLLVATYTLVIYDSDSSVTATPRAGYLDTFDQFTFGMYTSQPYKPIEDFVCATCSGAGSLVSHTLGFLFGLVVITVLSFGWFTGVAGLW